MSVYTEDEDKRLWGAQQKKLQEYSEGNTDWI